MCAIIMTFEPVQHTVRVHIHVNVVPSAYVAQVQRFITCMCMEESLGTRIESKYDHIMLIDLVWPGAHEGQSMVHAHSVRLHECIYIYTYIDMYIQCRCTCMYWCPTKDSIRPLPIIKVVRCHKLSWDNYIHVDDMLKFEFTCVPAW